MPLVLLDHHYSGDSPANQAPLDPGAIGVPFITQPDQIHRPCARHSVVTYSRWETLMVNMTEYAIVLISVTRRPDDTIRR